MQNRRVVVIGGGLAGREAAKCVVRKGGNAVLVTGNLDSHDRLNPIAIRFLSEEAPRVAEAWGPEGPSPGTEYAPAMRETLVGSLEIAARDFDNSIAELQSIGVRVMEGRARIHAPDVVRVEMTGGGTEDLICCAIILAVGTKPFISVEGSCILTPESMRSLEEIPESMIVLGSSPSVLELARFFAAYGVFVTVVGARKPALHYLDPDLHDVVVNSAADNDIRILTGVTAITGTTDSRVGLLLSDGSHIDTDCILPCGEGDYRTEGLNLEGPGVRTGPEGEILVDEHMRTNIPEIFAVGSVSGYHMRCTAVKQAKMAAENAIGEEPVINYRLIPITAWFDPQVGGVGYSEAEVRRGGFPVSMSSICMEDIEPPRWAKVVADESTGRVLGLHAVGQGAVEAIHMGALAMHSGIVLSDMAELTCADGTMSECLSAVALLGSRPVVEPSEPILLAPE